MSDEDREKKRKELKAIQDSLTPEERKEKARKAGIASGVAKRKVKDLKTIAKAIVDMKLSKRERAQLLELGASPEDVGDSKKGVGFFVCLENAIIKGDYLGFAKMMEIAGEYTPNPSLLVPTESDRQTVNVIMPGAIPPPPDTQVPAAFTKGDIEEDENENTESD